MQAIAIDTFNGMISLREMSIPTIGPEDVLVHIRAAGVNPLDWKVRDGLYKDAMMNDPFPLVLGYDASGVVVQVGANVTQFSRGDEVYGLFMKQGMLGGTYAEYIAIPAKAVLAHKPETLDFVHAAALPMPGITALAALNAASLRLDETLLVVGATGGIGSFVVQMASQRGIHVIATARPESETYVRGLGAAEFIDYTHTDGASAMRVAYPNGVNAIIDVVSDHAALRNYAELLRAGGHLVSTLGSADSKGVSIPGIQATNITLQPTLEQLKELTQMVDGGKLTVPLMRTFPLEQAAQALETIQHGHLRGKIVLKVA